LHCCESWTNWRWHPGAPERDVLTGPEAPHGYVVYWYVKLGSPHEVENALLAQPESLATYLGVMRPSQSRS
jgi:hypothetical protein